MNITLYSKAIKHNAPVYMLNEITDDRVLVVDTNPNDFDSNGLTHWEGENFKQYLIVDNIPLSIFQIYLPIFIQCSADWNIAMDHISLGIPFNVDKLMLAYHAIERDKTEKLHVNSEWFWYNYNGWCQNLFHVLHKAKNTYPEMSLMFFPFNLSNGTLFNESSDPKFHFAFFSDHKEAEFFEKIGLGTVVAKVSDKGEDGNGTSGRVGLTEMEVLYEEHPNYQKKVSHWSCIDKYAVEDNQFAKKVNLRRFRDLFGAVGEEKLFRLTVRRKRQNS